MAPNDPESTVGGVGAPPLLPDFGVEVPDISGTLDRATERTGELINSRTGLESGLSGGFDANYANTLEAFAGYSHAEMYGLVQALLPGDMTATSQLWSEAAQSIQQSCMTVTVSALREINDGWEGGTANDVRRVTGEVNDSGLDSATVMNSVGLRMTQANTVAEALKSTVPPPSPPTPMEALEPTTFAAAQARAEEERQRTIGLLNTIYTPQLRPTGDAVPAFGAGGSASGGDGGESGGNYALPGTRTGSGGGSTGLGPGSGTNGFLDGSGTGGAAPADTTAAAAGDGAGSPSSGAGSAGSGSNSGQGQGSAQPAGAGSTGATGTGPASLGAGSTRPASTAGSGIGGYGAPGSAAGGRSGSGSGVGAGRGTLGAPGGGSGGLSGAGSGAVGATPAAGAGGGAAGRTGFMPAGMMPAGRGSGGDDDEHRPASYLVDPENRNELIGDLPATVTPVLGEWKDE